MRERTPEKKPVDQDWHWADVLAALRKAGWSLRQLALAHKYTDGNTLGEAKRRPFPKGERLIAGAIGVKPEMIWPTRYDVHGKPNRRRGPAPMRPSGTAGKCTTRANHCNPQSKRGS